MRETCQIGLSAHIDLATMIKSFGAGIATKADDPGARRAATIVIDRAYKGYRADYEPELWIISEDDPERARKERLLAAIQSLATKYGDRIPARLWTVLAHFTSQPVPIESRQEIVSRRIADMPSLPFANWEADMYIHAFHLTPELALDVNTAFSRAAGVFVVHECCCGSRFVCGTIDAPLRPERKTDVENDYLANVLTIGLSMVEHNMPFEILCMENPIRQEELREETSSALVG